MPINNSYSQTPKRIFTNKPFIKGMNYTNADLEPFVCRAVSNLELESSNSATKLRPGIENKVIGESGEIAYKFYNKYVMFSNIINELLYNNDIALTNTYSNLGIRVLDNSYNAFSIYQTIITNNTELTYNNDITISGEQGITITDNTKIVALQMNEGDIPHCVNNEDYSFIFLGMIFSNDILLYKGFIKLYHHKVANKIIIEIIKPSQIDNIDINDYGLNLLSNTPSIYKDYVPFIEHDFYNEYMGVDKSKDVKNNIDLLTVALYDAPVNPYPYANPSTAKMLKGVNSGATNKTVYIRPYYVMPYGHYGAIIKASNKTGSEVYYNFSNNTFGLSANVTKVVKETKTLNIPIYSNNNDSDNAYDGVLDEGSVIISSCTMPSFNLLAYNTSFIENNALPPSELLIGGHNVYHIGFNKQSYNININKYTVPQYVNNGVLDNTITISNNSISANSRTEIKLNKCKQSSLSLNMFCTCDQYYKCDNDDSYIYPVNSNSVECNYELESVYNSYNGGIYSDHSKTILKAWFKSTVYVYNRMDVNNYIKTCTIFGLQDVLTMHITDWTRRPVPMPESYSFIRVGTPTATIVEESETPITISNNDYIYCKKYTISTYVTYECFSKDLVEALLKDPDSLHVVNNATDVDIDADYVYAIKSCDLGDEEVNDSWVITKAYIDTQGMNLPELTFNFNISINDSFNPTSEISTSPNYQGASAATLKLNLAIRTSSLNTINDNDNSTGYSITRSMECRQSGIAYITDSITVRNNTTYYYNTDFTSLNASEVVDFVESATANTYALANIELYTTKESAHISKNYVHTVQDINNNRYFNIPVSSQAFNSIIGSTIVVKLFPIINIHTEENSNAQFVEYKEIYVVEQPLYSIRTDLESVVDVSEIINDKFKTTALRMCNHLGHLVVWGDETNTNSLYYSAYGNISYFPSNYVITFDNPIVYAYPHKGNLVVFTTEDIYLLYNGNVPSTTTIDGSEVGFTQKLIQANTRLGKEHINTVRAVGKDLFFINNNNKGYLLKTNKYVNDDSDVYLVKLTTQIDDLLDNPYEFANERFNKWNTSLLITENINSQNNTLTVNPVVMNNLPDSANFIESVYTLDFHLDESNNFRIIDGDTFDIDGIRYRLADIDTPEITDGKNERLGHLAKKVLTELIQSGTNAYGAKLRIYDTGDIDKRERHLAYIFVQDDEEYDDADFVNVNATMLYSGLADFFDENHDKTASQILINYSRKAYVFAKSINAGVHSNAQYDEIYTNVLDMNSPADFNNPSVTYWLSDINKLYVYANNSYIFIIQSVYLKYLKSITLIYKYNIDSKIWTMYDILGYVNPTDIITDTNMLGFNILNVNDEKRYIPSLLSFTKNKYDINEISYNNDTYESLSEDYDIKIINKQFTINVYFDSGNQSISLMNDKLFREIKLSLGALPDGLLSMDYQIDFYVDGKLVIPNQLASCGNHIHQVPVNQHYKGREENLEGFQKITFFAPARGRIPRIVFSINTETDINILEYALVYMQLNAK